MADVLFLQHEDLEMATVTYHADAIVYVSDEKYGEEEYRHEIDWDGWTDEAIRTAAACGIWQRANQHTASQKKDKLPDEAQKIVGEMISYMMENQTLDKPESERRGRAYIDQRFLQALVAAGIEENLADAAETFRMSVTDEGFTTKAEVEGRVKELLAKYPDIDSAYQALGATGGSGKKL